MIAMIVASHGRPSVSVVWRALEPVAYITMSCGPAPTESTATTYWSLGWLCWSWTCTKRSLRSCSFSSFCVATTLPTTCPISISSRMGVLG